VRLGGLYDGCMASVTACRGVGSVSFAPPLPPCAPACRYRLLLGGWHMFKTSIHTRFLIYIYSDFVYFLYMKKRYWLLPLSLPLLLLTVPAGLNYSGFCWDQKRWLSDEEYIKNAASLIQKVGPSYNSIEYTRQLFPSEKEGWLLEYTVYDPEKWHINPDGSSYLKEKERKRDVQEFFSHYPNCCRIVDRDTEQFIRPPSFWEKIYGYRAAIVQVISDVDLYNTKTEQYKTLKNFESYVALENCGSPNQAATY
jgi:hypothetical protein